MLSTVLSFFSENTSWIEKLKMNLFFNQSQKLEVFFFYLVTLFDIC